MDPVQSAGEISAASSQPDEQPPSPVPRTRSRRPPAQPRRYGFACANCHARKVKCNGKQPTCRTCQQSGARCVWRSSAEKQLRDANSRIRMLEEAVQAATRSETPDLDHSREGEEGEGEAVTHSAATTTSSTAGTGGNPSATSPASGTSAWFQVGLGHNGAVTYNGPTSRFHASALEEHLADEDGPQASRQSSDKRAIHVEALRCQYDLLDTVWMPLIRSKSGFDGFGVDANVCLALLDIYWNWLQPLHNCVYRPCFMMDMAIGGPYYSDFLLMSIFALSARHLSEQDRAFESVGKGEYFLSRARELLLDEMSSSKPKIPTIQGLLILGGRQCAIGKSSEGWLYTGMAIRMLLDLGLHLHLGNSYLADLERLTATEVEVRRRLYNSAYIWDKTLSLALGRPPSLIWAPHDSNEILDHYDDTMEWKPVYAPEISQGYQPVPSYNTMAFCAHSQLHKITTDMMLLFSNMSFCQNLTAEINSLDGRFARWYADIPAELRMDDISNLSQSPPPHIVSLNLLYHALYILLYRPSLNSPDVAVRSSSASTCISHSKDIHTIFSLYGQTFPNRLMTYQVSYCVFTAASVDIYSMKTSCVDGVTEAVTRLGDAIRVLQNEARHTPGIARSLDTIRRQLTTWKPSTKMSLGESMNPLLQMRQNHHSQRIAGTETEDSLMERNHEFDNVIDGEVLSKESQVQTSGMSLDSSSYQLENGVIPMPSIGATLGGVDTGAGFHPDVFPWGLTDLLDKDGSFDSVWWQNAAANSTFY